MVPEPLVDVVAVRAVGGYLLELAYPHGQVRLLDPEPLLWPRAYDAVRADHAAFAAVRVNSGGALVWPGFTRDGHPTRDDPPDERAGLTSTGAAKPPLAPRQAIHACGSCDHSHRHVEHLR